MIKSKNSDPSQNRPLDEPGIASSGFGAPPVSRGHKTPPQLPQDDLTTQNEVEQGVDDAEDDSIARASNRTTRAEG